MQQQQQRPFLVGEQLTETLGVTPVTALQVSLYRRSVVAAAAICVLTVLVRTTETHTYVGNLHAPESRCDS